MTGWWWLSFADERGFLGVAIVEGPTMFVAVGDAWHRGINPGGEVMGVPIYERLPAPEWRNRLLTRAECERLNDLMDLGGPSPDPAKAGALGICEEHNKP